MSNDWINSEWFKIWKQLAMAREDKDCRDWGAGQWYCYVDRDGKTKWIFIIDPLPKN